MSRIIIRVNPDFLIDDGPETSVPIQAVVRPLSHPVFSSTKIRLFGPLGAAVPLREFTVAPDEDVVAGVKVTNERRRLQPWLPDPYCTTYYTPYIPQDLTEPQFKVMIQFHRFAKGEDVLPSQLSQRAIRCVLSANNNLPDPYTRFIRRTRRWRYTGWTRAHFLEFFRIYRSAILSSTADGSGILELQGLGEWIDAVPPIGMGCEEWETLFMEIGGLENVSTDEERWDVAHVVGADAAQAGSDDDDDAAVAMRERRKKKKSGEKDRLAALWRDG
ncbi:hypothetical protein MGYG_04586 [Nannizzia gypsea CBS 118893]|uniref:Uncharacterized protein n=1 Tax=Arthroderma gypseum (strain ATCC MYA-4604 / CBS 118893) TaxID=535722 RepID=E4UTU0_ARTGP|nr:hypothetical protein MGYG_04586 [Nannizzia gypsea CBS 118893]EFR01583.1 hypothetical protein MGYG_04586 [Nannizzia gypsea CBS 118893]